MEGFQVSRCGAGGLQRSSRARNCAGARPRSRLADSASAPRTAVPGGSGWAFGRAARRACPFPPVMKRLFVRKKEPAVTPEEFQQRMEARQAADAGGAQGQRGVPHCRVQGTAVFAAAQVVSAAAGSVCEPVVHRRSGAVREGEPEDGQGDARPDEGVEEGADARFTKDRRGQAGGRSVRAGGGAAGYARGAGGARSAVPHGHRAGRRGSAGGVGRAGGGDEQRRTGRGERGARSVVPTGPSGERIAVDAGAGVSLGGGSHALRADVVSRGPLDDAAGVWGAHSAAGVIERFYSARAQRQRRRTGRTATQHGGVSAQYGVGEAYKGRMRMLYDNTAQRWPLADKFSIIGVLL
eukprot:ctg_949.g219